MAVYQTLKKGFKQRRRWLKRRLHTCPLWYQEPDFIFIHINKTGGSSIEKALNLPFEHLTAMEKRAEVGADKWEQKFTFAFVRNPFDKVCSHYRYRVKTNQTNLKDRGLSFSQWVNETYGRQNPDYYDNPKMFMPQSQWLTDEGGHLLVDEVYRFERLSDDFRQVTERFKLNTSLPHLKASKKTDYQQWYDEATKQTVADWFAEDLRRFGYCF